MVPQYCILDTGKAVFRLEKDLGRLTLLAPSLDEIAIIVTQAFATATEDRLHTLGDWLTVLTESSAPESHLSSLLSVDPTLESHFHSVLQQARNNEAQVLKEYRYVAELIYRFGEEVDAEYLKICDNTFMHLPYVFKGWVNKDLSLAFDPHAGNFFSGNNVHVNWRK